MCPIRSSNIVQSVVMCPIRNSNIVQSVVMCPIRNSNIDDLQRGGAQVQDD
jgi:hypothetical protein